MTEPRKFPTIIPAGMHFTVSTGVYSDYCITGVFVAKVDIDTVALLTEWLAANPDKESEHGYNFDDDAFFAAMAARGLFEPVASMEWHLTDYGRSSEMVLFNEVPA